VQPIIETKLREHQQRLAHLRSCHEEEMLKNWRHRNMPYLTFLWKELSMYECVVAELEDLLAHLRSGAA
jgi:hypothetical protein